METIPRPMLTDDPALPPVMRVLDHTHLENPPVFTHLDGAHVNRLRVHPLKTSAPHFGQVWCGRKRAELRLNDRGFRQGDALWLREINANGPDGFGPRAILARITHVLDAGDVDERHRGWSVLSLQLEARFTR